jgi:hypothetical protein
VSEDAHGVRGTGTWHEYEEEHARSWTSPDTWTRLPARSRLDVLVLLLVPRARTSNAVLESLLFFFP